MNSSSPAKFNNKGELLIGGGKKLVIIIAVKIDKIFLNTISPYLSL